MTAVWYNKTVPVYLDAQYSNELNEPDATHELLHHIVWTSFNFVIDKASTVLELKIIHQCIFLKKEFEESEIWV